MIGAACGTTTRAARARKRARRREREDRDYLAWVHTMPCAVCGRSDVTAHHEPLKGQGGGGDWSDRKTIPLCPEHHQDGADSRHKLGSLSLFEETHGLSVSDIITELNTIYGRSER